MVTPQEHRAAIEHLMRLFRNEFYVYDPELFEQRLREEKLRADLLDTSFAYLEIPFSEMFSDDLRPEELRPAWRAVMLGMTMLMRGSDVKGFLGDDRGLGFLFLDSTAAPAARLFENLRRYLSDVHLEARIHPALLARKSFPFVVYRGRNVSVDAAPSAKGDAP